MEPLPIIPLLATPSCPILLPSACSLSVCSCISDTAAILANRATAALTSLSLAAADSLNRACRRGQVRVQGWIHFPELGGKRQTRDWCGILSPKASSREELVH